MKQPDVVTEAMLAGLPEPVQRYMNWTGVVGQPWIRTAYIKQSGLFRLGLDKPWMPLKAEQIFTVDPPGLRWNARFKLYGLPLMSARATYQNGQGHMYGKLAGLITLFDDRGEKLTLGAQMRYREVKGDNVYLPWITVNEAYGVHEGLNLPTRSLVSWQLPEGLLTYGDIHLNEVKYNRPGDRIS